mgnify:CR=1 FL=1
MPEKLAGTRLAIVEDDMMLRESLAAFFRAKGCYVETFGSAEDAKAIEGRKDLDAVISDYLLPGDDGLSVLRRVREASPNVITILITSYPGSGIAVRAESAGADRILLKPFSTKELEESLHTLLEKRGPKSGFFLAAGWDGVERRKSPRNSP